MNSSTNDSTFEVSMWVDDDLVKQIVDDQPDRESAQLEAQRLVGLRFPALDIEVVDYLTVYMGSTAEQTLLMGVGDVA